MFIPRRGGAHTRALIPIQIAALATALPAVDALAEESSTEKNVTEESRLAVPAFLSAAGVLPGRVHAVFLNADTELSGYPAGFVGWRVGLGGLADLGLEVGGNDVAVLGRLHAKLRLWETHDHRWFAGARLRLELKRHKQSFPAGIFRPIDDLGPTFVPELSIGWRLGAKRKHALFFASFYYLDVDVRSGEGLDHYLLPGMIGYEGRLWRGLHLGVEAGVFFELFRTETAGEPLVKAGVTLGWEIR